MFVAQLNLGAFGDNEGKLNSFRPGSLAFQKYAPDACQNQFSSGAAAGGGLLLQLSVKGFRNINRCANRFLLHKTNYLKNDINMERRALALPFAPAIMNSALLCANLFVGEQVGVPLEHAGRLVGLSATYKPSRPISRTVW